MRRNIIVTLKDIAKIAGVDVSTVSRALNDSNVISKEVKEKIKKIAKELNYERDAYAFSLRKGIKQTIAVVTPTIEFAGGEFYSSVIRGVDRVINEKKFSILFATFLGNFKRIVRERRIDGAVIVGDIYSNKDIEEIFKLDIPTVFINQKIRVYNNNFVSIYLNNEKVIEEITTHLVEKHQRSNFLFLGGGDKYQTSRLRKKGFIYVMKKYGIKNYKIIDMDFATALPDSFKTIGNLLKNKKFNFDGIVCASDKLAIGVISALINYNPQRLKDISITGFDNIEFSRYVTPPLTTVDPKAELMGEEAAKLLIEKVLHKKKFEYNEIEIEAEIIYRKSCVCD